MKRTLPLLLLVICMYGCSKTAEFNRVIDYSEPFTLTRIGQDSASGYDVFLSENLPLESEKSERIRRFLNTHSDGWNTNIASIIGDMTVSQGDFRMIYSEGAESVSITYLDKDGRPTQLSRRIEPGALDFLFD